MHPAPKNSSGGCTENQYKNAELGDMIKVEIHSKEFGRIATQNAKNVILQKIR